MKLIKNKIEVLIICGLGVIIVGMNYKLIMTVILHPTQFDILVGVMLNVWINKLIVNHKLNQLLEGSN